MHENINSISSIDNDMDVFDRLNFNDIENAPENNTAKNIVKKKKLCKTGKLLFLNTENRSFFFILITFFLL